VLVVGQEFFQFHKYLKKQVVKKSTDNRATQWKIRTDLRGS